MEAVIALGALAFIVSTPILSARLRAKWERQHRIAADLRRADDTHPGGDLGTTGFADKIFLGGDGGS